MIWVFYKVVLEEIVHGQMFFKVDICMQMLSSMAIIITLRLLSIIFKWPFFADAMMKERGRLKIRLFSPFQFDPTQREKEALTLNYFNSFDYEAQAFSCQIYHQTTFF